MELGPTQIRPALITSLENFEFSDKKPYPGCTACAPVLIAASIISLPLRYVSDSLIASSANLTKGDLESASVYTATQEIPIS